MVEKYLLGFADALPGALSLSVLHWDMSRRLDQSEFKFYLFIYISIFMPCTMRLYTYYVGVFIRVLIRVVYRRWNSFNIQTILFVEMSNETHKMHIYVLCICM